MAADTATTLESRPGQTFEVTVSKTLVSEGARKTVQRLFMSDPEFRAPIDARTKHHKDRPKRRGGRIYTKYTRKVHPDLPVGASAKVAATTQHARDLASVSRYVTVK
jgi:hypothetical protein